MTKLAIALLALVLMAFPASAYSESISLPSIGSTEVVIVNQADRSLHFSLRTEDGEWTEYTIDSGDNETFDCQGKCEGEYEFYMKTEERHVHYRLEARERYAIRWNEQGRVWDLVHVTEPVRSD